MKNFLIFLCKILEISGDSKTFSSETELAIVSNVRPINTNVETISVINQDFVEEECIFLTSSTRRNAQCGKGTMYLCSIGHGKCSDWSEKKEI